MNTEPGRRGFQKSLTDEQEQELVRLCIETERSYADIGGQLGVSAPTVYRVLRRHGFQGIRNPRTSSEDRRRILVRCFDGEARVDVADEFGVDVSTVNKMVRSYNG